MTRAQLSVALGIASMGVLGATPGFPPGIATVMGLFVALVAYAALEADAS